VEVLRLPDVEPDVLAVEAGGVVQVVLADIPAAERPERLHVVARGLVAVDGSRPRLGVHDEAAVHAHLEVQRRVDVTVVEVRPRVHRAELIRVLPGHLEAHVTHTIVVRTRLHAMMVNRVDVLRGLERVMEHLAGTDAAQRGGEQVVPVVRLERPELHVLAAQLDLVADELGLERDVGLDAVRRLDVADLRGLAEELRRLRLVVEADFGIVGGDQIGHQCRNSNSVSIPFGYAAPPRLLVSSW
jgi:hypothetical protein